MPALTPQQRLSFREHGFLVIPKFFEPSEVEAARASYDRVWRERPADVVVDTEGYSTHRIRAVDMTEEERHQPFKVNDLYLTDPRLREVILSERLGAILRELLADEPVICNTLTLEFGSQQADHLDTLFMTPHTDGRLVATWMALEDVHPDAGPLRFYPESNHIEPFRFRDGSFHVNQAEMDRWCDYMAAEVERHGLEESRFLAERGDLFVWDAWLLHGGAEICATGLTRHSVVTHYFTKADCLALGSKLLPTPGGWWMDRPGPSPSMVVSDEGVDAPMDSAGDIPQTGMVPTESSLILPSRELRDRLASLDPHGDRVGP